MLANYIFGDEETSWLKRPPRCKNRRKKVDALPVSSNQMERGAFSLFVFNRYFESYLCGRFECTVAFLPFCLAKQTQWSQMIAADQIQMLYRSISQDTCTCRVVHLFFLYLFLIIM